MSGTRDGGLKAARANKQRYGDSFFSDIGRKGGKKSSGGPFMKDPEFAREAGKLGGKVSKRGKAKVYAPIPAIPEPFRPARNELGQFMREYSFSGTYGSLEAPESVEAIKDMTDVRYVQQLVPGWLYGVWIVGSITGVMFSFFLGSLAYK